MLWLSTFFKMYLKKSRWSVSCECPEGRDSPQVRALLWAEHHKKCMLVGLHQKVSKNVSCGSEQFSVYLRLQLHGVSVVYHGKGRTKCMWNQKHPPHLILCSLGPREFPHQTRPQSVFAVCRCSTDLPKQHATETSVAITYTSCTRCRPINVTFWQTQL